MLSWDRELCSVVLGSGWVAHGLLIGGKVFAGHPFVTHRKGTCAFQLLGPFEGSGFARKHVIVLRLCRGDDSHVKEERDKATEAEEDGGHGGEVLE